MIIFHKIRYKNLLSVGNYWLEVSLDQFSSTLFLGANGAGKSIILDAVIFALFNKSFRGLNKADLINSITNNNLVVEMEFTIGSNRYRVIRGMKPNLFEIYKNEVLLDQNKDYQRTLEKQILKLNYKSFCQVVILGSRSYIPFMDLEAKDRREVIEDLLDLKIFSTMGSLLKIKVDELKNSLVTNQQSRELLEMKIRMMEQHVLEAQKDNQKIIESKKERISSTLLHLDRLEAEKENFAQKVSEILRLRGPTQSIIDKISKFEKVQGKLNNKLETLIREVDFFRNHEQCPTCSQLMEEKFRINTIDDKNEELGKLESALEDLDKLLKQEKLKFEEQNKLDNQVRDLNYKIFELETTIEGRKNYIQELEEEIQQLQNKIVQETDNKITELQSQLDVANGELKKLQEKQELFGVSSLMLKDNGIKSKIIAQYVPIINELVNSYLSKFDFFVNFELDENFDEKIKSRNRDNFKYNSFSDGQKLRIDLALMFTWRDIARMRNSVNTNLLIMDEVFDKSLDVEGIENLFGMIKNLTTGSNCFMISPKGQNFTDQFDRVIQFELKRNFTHMGELV